MDICDPEILRTERFGSRELLKTKKRICRFCGAEILENFFCDISGNLFCCHRCREERDIRGKEIKK